MAEPKQLAKNSKDAGSEAKLIVPLLLLLGLGAGVGFGYGMLSGQSNKNGEAANGSAIAGDAPAAAGEAGVRAEAGASGKNDWRNEVLVPLQPPIVRMGGGNGKWLRLEGAVAFHGPSKDDRTAMTAQLGEDLMLLLASTALNQIASPTGLEFLRDDMNDIVQSRTNGMAGRFVLKSLVVE